MNVFNHKRPHLHTGVKGVEMEKTELQFDCKERVAFDLMKAIADGPEKTTKRNRNYILTLYRECLWATRVPKDPSKTE